MDENEAIDYQVESQRGLFVCGMPFFTNSWLLPFDPYPFTNLEGHSTGSELRQFQVPNPDWEWEWPNWVIDMNGPVDYHGWSYNFWFSKKNWHDGNVMGRCFVRQRRWMRLRKYIKAPDDISEKMFDARDIIHECRNDRERTDAIVKYISEDTVESMISGKREILAAYQFPQNIEALNEKLRHTTAGQRFVDAE